MVVSDNQTAISYSVSAGLCSTNSLLIQLLCGLSADKHLWIHMLWRMYMYT